MKIVDINTWNRKVAYNNFINYTDPVFSVSTRLDVTELLDFCKTENKSFFPTFLYIVSKCVNEVPEMKMRIVNDEVVQFDTVNPSYIVICENDELATHLTGYQEDYEIFYNLARTEIDELKQSNPRDFNGDLRYDCFFVSCLPWTDMVSVKNPYNLADKSQTSIPRITWGKYVPNGNGRYEMGFDISAHHALIDGKQVADVFEKIRCCIKNIRKELQYER